MPINKDFYSPELFSYTFDIFKKLNIKQKKEENEITKKDNKKARFN